MKEQLLQFIWQQQYFTQHELNTTSGEFVRIIKPGEWNAHQGPDFTEALIQIGNTTWGGQVEIHYQSSDWFRHGHSNDQQYANVILHVVWEDDQPVLDKHENVLPTLVLGDRIPKVLLSRYQEMMDRKEPLICRSFLPALTLKNWNTWKERLIKNRLERKAARILEWHAKAGGDWDVVFWQLLFEQMGGKVNGNYFLSLANSLPLTILIKKQLSAFEWEALLLGQANLLPVTASASYHRKLLKEYQYLQYKYQLVPLRTAPAFLRMRPASFPTIRISQLAGLLLNHPRFFSTLVSTGSLQQWKQQCRVTAAEFWDTHYLINRPSHPQPKTLGTQMIYSLAINAILPALYAYAFYKGDQELVVKVLALYADIPSEQNRITSLWDNTGVEKRQALDTQALTELTNLYCTKKLCLQCAVGKQILQS
jgi:hypothetical protein